VIQFARSALQAFECWIGAPRQSILPWRDLARIPEFKNARVAIVGNAGYLSEMQQGTSIDDYDIVLRMNNCRTATFERQVGTKTDIFLTTFHRDVDLQNPAISQARWIVTSVPFNHFKSNRHSVHFRHADFIARGLAKVNRNQAYVPDWQYFLEQKKRIGRYPTSGAMAILMATDMLAAQCKEIYLTGFSFFQGASHYFSDRVITPRNHDLERERIVMCEQLQPFLDSGLVRCDPTMHAILHS
jgi:hypothetical protein